MDGFSKEFPRTPLTRESSLWKEKSEAISNFTEKIPERLRQSEPVPRGWVGGGGGGPDNQDFPKKSLLKKLPKRVY
jgi:hypothetical protein